MRSSKWNRILGAFAALAIAAATQAATFGTLVPVRGTVSDIALDERRLQLYIANFSANRVDVMSTTSRTLGDPMPVFKPPSAVALSPDNRYLVVGHYDTFATASAKGGYTIFDLDAGLKQEVAIGNPVLAVSFGSGTQALVVTTGEILLLDPQSARTQSLTTTTLSSTALPVPFATFPPNIIKASTGVSGDRKTIVVLAEAAGSNAIFRYQVGDDKVTLIQYVSSPPLGPRAVSVNQDGSSFMVGWILLDSRGLNIAQFPYPLGEFRAGGHAFDNSRNLLYADIPTVANESPVMHIVDTDNLTVRERIQLPQMMSGRSVFSSDNDTLYAASDSGVMVLPIGSLDRLPRITILQEDVLFLADTCNRRVITQTIDVVEQNGGRVDFSISLPPNTSGVRLFPSSNTTPASVRIEVDPTVYQNAKGTTSIPLNLQSNGSVNIPVPARILINTRDFNQRGRIVNVPGKITDIISDRFRNRVYLIRQDKNLVLVYDSTSFRQIASLRTGNTPTGMAITEDQRYLIVGNDNSQLANVFDLETLQPSAPILFNNAYPRSIAVARGAIWASVRGGEAAKQALHRVDFAARIANVPPTLGIYNNLVPATAVLTSSPSSNSIFMAIPDGNVLLWDASVDLWVVSRKDLPGLSGAYGSFGDNLFTIDNNLLDQSLFPMTKLPTATGASSGVGLAGGAGLRTTTATPSGAGTIERIDLENFQAFHGTPFIEAPVLVSTLTTARVGQIGQTITPFTRTLAVPPDESSIILITQSGLTVLASNFDAPTQVPSVSGVVNSADGEPPIAPGGLITISGTGLSPTSASAIGLPLPSTLGDACVTVNNVALPLFRVSPTEITAQLPFSVTGEAPMVVRSPGGLSAPFTVRVLSFAPAIFRSGSAGDQTGIATVYRQKNNDLVTFTNPIHPDEGISIFLTGLGPTSPPAPLGDAAPADPLAIAATPPTVTLGGTELEVTFAGLVPGQVGIYQIDAYVPSGIRDAAQTTLGITQGTVTTELQVRVVNP
ncbi:MAG: hypothetical protein JJE04_07645 [Acidobacteriia bacterium]|nr:hypothetical protein [Terriglobia bacterium]